MSAASQRRVSAPLRYRAGRRHGSSTEPWGPIRRGGIPGRGPRPRWQQTPRGARSAQPAGAGATGADIGPAVRMSTPISRVSRRTCRTSSLLSPRPSIRPGLGDGAAPLGVSAEPRSFAHSWPARAPVRDRRGRSRGCGRRRRAPASSTVSTAPVSPLKSPVSTSSTRSGQRRFTARMVAAQWAAPPSCEIVAIHAGDDGVAQAELGQHGGHPLGLVGIGRQRAGRWGRRRTGRSGCRCRPGS